MHGCGLGSALLVNAEVDSMGGVVDGGVGIGIKTSPRRAAIERAQVELRQEYDVREERRRELEFLEKGGNPLDFKFGNAASVSVQSTSLTDHQIEHIVTSEAKGSFALTASPHGDSVESSGRPGAPTVCEPNSADNFDAENEILESGRNPKHPRRSNVAPSEQSSQMDGTQNAKESEDSAVVRPYARRNRSRPNRDGARSSSTDVVQNSGGHGSLLQVRGGSRDAKGSISDTNQEKEWNTPSGSNPKSTASNGDMVSQVENANAQPPMELDGAQASEVVAGSFKSSIQDNRMDVTEASIAGDSQQEKKNFSEVNDQKMPVDVASGECDQAGVDEQLTLAGSVSPTVSAVAKPENENGSVPLNGFSELKKDGNEVHNGNGAMGLKGLDSESSCTQSSLVDANNENGVFVNGRNDDTNGIIVKQTSAPEEMQNSLACETGNEKNEVKAIDCGDVLKEDETLLQLNQPGNDSAVKIEEEIKMSTDDAKCTSNFKGVENSDHDASMVDKKLSADLVDDSNLSKEIICPDVPQSSVDISNKELPESTSAEKNCSAAPDPQPSSDSHLIAAEKAREDSLLEEARSIEAKLKRIAELTVGIVPMESRRKSHWDFVLEEMTWLANDFAQERLWKITAAAQICHRAAFSSRLRVEEQNQLGKPKKVAYTLAKAVMEFWHLAESLITNDDQFVDLQKDKNELKSFDGNKLSKDKSVELDKDSCKELESQIRGKNLVRLIQGYAVNFLKFNKSSVPSLQAEAPATPDRLVDLGIAGTSWEDHLTEESLFYAVPPGAMEAYRISIESHLSQCEKTGSNIQEEVDTSMYDATADFGYRETAYDEEDGETNAYYLHGGFEGIKLTKHDQKKKKNLKYPADFPYGTYSVVSQPNTLLKRPANNLHVGAIPTKRVRTTPRPRFIGPYTSGATGSLQTPTKTDPSSGDTSSFQDEQSTLHGGSQVLKGMEVESAVEQLTYDCAETSTKPKKKKKAKHLLQASAYEGWQLDSPVHNEQKDNFKKRLDSPHFDSNGTSGLYGQHIAKKPKIMKQSLDSNYDNMAQSGSIPSPVASQMSNMPSANKVVKLIVGRDRGRKPKTHKVPSGPQGPGSAWSLFEDQALVVLVHDMGPNWELVSDAINSALQFKCIFRKPKECKERHKILMDKSGGDDYDSADDSRNSQSYPSTLPGIPKGSARQLFQRLQGPMEEDTIKSHFEKIIVIGKKYHYRRNQNDNQDLKQIVPVHSSHIAALDQVPTNQNGGVLTPLDIWDAAPATPDGIPMTYQSSHAGGLPFTNQGAAGSTLPSGVNSSLQVSPGAVLGNTSSSSAPPNGPVRDGRYGVPRASLSVDEQQRMQHYNQMMNRNLQPQNLSVSGADRGVRLLPGGNPAGMMPGMGRSMPLPRPGFQGMASSSMLNSGSMLSSGMAGMPSPVGMQSASGSGQGNSMMRSRDGPHMMRAAQNSEHQRQMMAPELQMQVTQAHSPAIPAFNGLNSTPPAMPAYPGHSQQQHQMPLQQTHPMTNSHLQGSNHLTGSQQQAYAMRISKQRQMQQQQHQHHPFAASGALMSRAQPSSQLPVSSTVQSSAQIQPQTSLQPLTPSSPMTPMLGQPQQQKHALLHHGVSRNSQTVAGGLTNQMGKQRPRQPQQNQQFQQSGRIHPPQRQHSQSPQPAKHLKGMGRGNVVLPQNLSVDHSPLNGLSVPPGNQSADKGEHMMHLIQGQGLYSGSALSSMPQSKPLVTQSLNHSQSQQKPFSAAALPSSKQVQQTQSHTDNNPQGQVPSVPSSHPLSAGHQVHPAAILASNHQHLHPQPQAHQKQAGHAQPTVQRMLQQNRQMNADPQTKSQTDQGHTAQQPLCNVSQMGTSTTTSMSPASNDSASVVPAVASQWKPSDSSCPALVNSASPAGSVAGLAVTNSVRSEAVSSVNQGLGQRQLSGGLMQQNSAGVQRPPHPLPPQSAPPPPQQLFQPQEQQEQQQSRQQLPSQPHSQQHNPHLQPAQGSLYIRPANSQME